MNYGYKRSGQSNLAPTFNAEAPKILSLGVANSSDNYEIPFDIKPFDQGQVESCVANSTIMSLMIAQYIQNPANVETLSRLFLYWNVRLFDGTETQNTGAYIHNAFRSLMDQGCCREDLFPYDSTKIFTAPPIMSYKEGNDNKITSFYQIASSGNQRVADICAALKSNHPIVFGTTIGNALESYDGSANTVLSLPTDNQGAHAMCCVGYKTLSDGTKAFKIRNSWGSWGIGGEGFFWMSQSWMASNETSDIFVPTLIPNLLQE